jgi:hypothetical protein
MSNQKIRLGIRWTVGDDDWMSDHWEQHRPTLYARTGSDLAPVAPMLWEVL